LKRLTEAPTIQQTTTVAIQFPNDDRVDLPVRSFVRPCATPDRGGKSVEAAEFSLE